MPPKTREVRWSEGETRHASLKRTNEALQDRLSALERSIKHICNLPEDEAQSFLKRARQTADPLGTLVSLSMGTPATSLEHQAAQAVLPQVQTKLEYELMVTNSFAYEAIESIDIDSLVNKIPGKLSSLEALRSLQGVASLSTSQSEHQSLKNVPKSPVRRSRPEVAPEGPEPPPDYCDSRLKRLDVRFWTRVPASTEFAARALSRWLYSYQAFECFFDVELFIDDLASKRRTFCSSLLMNAVMDIASLGYSSIDPMAIHLRPIFEAEAERLWSLEPGDSLLKVSAAHVLGVAYIWDMNEEKAAHFFQEGLAMVHRMDLYCIGLDAKRKLASLPRLSARAHAYTAWGVFNYYTIRSLYYRTDAPAQAPDCPIPGDDWRYPEEPSALLERKYHEILDWSRNLSPPPRNNQGALYRHTVFRMYLHSSIMDIFRPFLDRNLTLTTFSSPDATPNAVFLASLTQLKHLGLEFYVNFPEALYSCQWQHACLYIANAAVRNISNPDSRFYYLFSLQGYLNLTATYPFTRMVFTSLLTMGVRSGNLTLMTAKGLYDQMIAVTTKSRSSLAFGNGKLVVDLETALTHVSAAQMDVLAEEMTFKIACDDFLE
ncbi:hypothetical protein Q7P37_005489 [Cladosporium fusiforme]